ncbi:hypothetical protein WJX84_009936 [Apatococcus fuscideae]|uniref:Uncharacterized protein n=1 Tax=Apatococcus fuscideae TaxID=2026836 RepID=A0AAW1SRR2_9CHLO
MGSQEAPTRSQASPWRREPLRRSSSSGRGSVGSQRQGFQAAAGPLQDFHSVLGLTPSGKETHMDDGGWGLPLKRAPPRREATDMQPMAPGPEPQAPPSQSGFPRQSGSDPRSPLVRPTPGMSGGQGMPGVPSSAPGDSSGAVEVPMAAKIGRGPAGVVQPGPGGCSTVREA